MKHLDLLVGGRVQGVSLRLRVKEYADAHGIYGYARNLRDGTVRIEAEGDDAALAELQTWLTASPGASEVRDLDVKEGAVRDYRDFQIF